MDGDATPAQIGGLLVALRMKGETVDEIAGAARAMRALRDARCRPRATVVDTCGTGGDGAARSTSRPPPRSSPPAPGVAVAKHGNRAMSGAVGGADVLEALGVRIDLDAGAGRRPVIDEVGIGFLFAPRFHPAMRHVAGPRRELGVRTIFNLLGPLTNPAGARHQLVGVFAAEWVEPLAQALGRLGSQRALVVHGDDGLDEISLDRRRAWWPSCATAPCAPTASTRTASGLRRCRREPIWPAATRPTTRAIIRADARGRGQRRARDIALLNAARGALRRRTAPTASPAGLALRAREPCDSGARGRQARRADRVHQPMILDDIVAARRDDVARAKRAAPLRGARERGRATREPRRGFAAALRARRPAHHRRGEEGLAVEGRDPRRLRPGRDRARAMPAAARRRSRC